MYSTYYSVDSLPQAEIDLDGVYHLLKDDFFRPAGTDWSYSSSVGWFENKVNKPLASGGLFPLPLVADKYLKVNSSGTAYEFVDAPTGSSTVIDCIISSSSWSGTTQSITATGVTVTNEVWWDASTLADNILAGKANLFCSAQGIDSLTFQCITVPTSDINIKVTIR